MGKFNDLYLKRLAGKNFITTKELEQLALEDEKTFYFVLMYFYYNKENLGCKVRYSPILVTAITLFCLTLKNDEVTNYFSTYLDLKEIPEQIQKIYNELRLID